METKNQKGIKKRSIKKLKLKTVGSFSWEKTRELIVLKFMEAKTEEEFSAVLEMILKSTFSSVDELEKTRKELNLPAPSKEEKKKIRGFLK